MFCLFNLKEISMTFRKLLRALAGAAAVACLARVRGRRTMRRAAGACLACGYSLRGNVSGVCPECGMAAGAAAGTGRDSADPGIR